MSRIGAGDGEEVQSEWEAYSDFQTVSERIASSINDATHAYSDFRSAARSGYKLTPKEETQLRADILGATMRLRTELEHEREKREIYDDILTRWEGDDGLLQRFNDANLPYDTGEWLEQLIEDVRRAGWELGYLKAGRENKIGESGDGHDGQLKDMIDGGEI